METIDASSTITGFLVGSIWMPQTECYKHLSYDVYGEQARTDGKMTLRDHVLRATNDGDFQSCEIADGELTVTIYKRNGSSTIRRTRSWSLDRFPSISDMIRTDWDGPCLEEEAA